MTFRPTDDVLDSMENSQQPQAASNQYTQITDESVSNDSNGSRIFSNPDADENNSNNVENANIIPNTPVEEVKAPDLSQLLENSGNAKNWGDTTSGDNVTEEAVEEDFTVDLSEIESSNWWESSGENNAESLQPQNNTSASGWWAKQEEEAIPWKMLDKEREEIISWMEWSVHSKLDLLVDNEWKSVVEKYRKIYRILFRWWTFILTIILWVLWWVMVQVKANQWNNAGLIWESSITNKNDWRESNSDKILADQITKDNDIEPIISYGLVSFNNKSFQSKSNLIKYQWIVLPQLISLDFWSTKFIPLDKFENKEATREDLEMMVNDLIKNEAIYRKTSALPNVSDYLWKWKTLEWWLIDGFNLWCVKNEKLWDFVCDKLLERFYKYGQYYDLSSYSSDLLVLVRELNRQNKDFQPICKMIPEYIWHSWEISSDILSSVMNFCSEEDFHHYKKIVNFIDIDNSLRQFELSDKVLDDPDLNAYKLLSSQQVVYRLINSSSMNENFIKSYLTFVQNLINKDNKSGKYISPVYKDLLYVFNTDVLYTTLIEKGKLSTKLNSQLDQINNGNPLLDYPSLTSLLTTPNIVGTWGDFVFNTQESTIEELLLKYYMNDHLQIRRATKLSDIDIQVQTEIYSDDIFKVTGWQTLKATIVLHKKQNVLYVKSINISNQRDLSQTLNIYAGDWNVSFDKMLWYINEQIAFWYKAPWEDWEIEFTLCDRLGGKSKVELFTCDESSVVLYKSDTEYAFTLVNWILDSFVVSDSALDSALKEMFGSVMTSRDNTPTVIESIIDFDRYSIILRIC